MSRVEADAARDPPAPGLDHPRVLGEGHVGRALANSLIVASATTVICVIVAGMAAYALARLHIPLRRTLLMLILTTQMFPLVVLIIPLS
jgi:ABC-type glycerol-3-phosphate transport system permease component